MGTKVNVWVGGVGDCRSGLRSDGSHGVRVLVPLGSCQSLFSYNVFSQTSLMRAPP